MSEAWRIRDIQRQATRGVMVRALRDLEDELKCDSSVTALTFCSMLIDHLKGQVPVHVSPNDQLKDLPKIQEFQRQAMESIATFGRTPSERNAVIVDLLKEVLETAIMPFHTALIIDEREHPQTIFSANSTMDDMFQRPPESGDGPNPFDVVVSAEFRVPKSAPKTIPDGFIKKPE